MNPIPASAEALIEELNQTYPRPLPDASDNERDIWMRVGQRRLVEALLRRLEYTQEDVLGRSLTTTTRTP